MRGDPILNLVFFCRCFIVNLPLLCKPNRWMSGNMEKRAEATTPTNVKKVDGIGEIIERRDEAAVAVSDQEPIWSAAPQNISTL